MTRACKDCVFFQEIRHRGGECRFEPPRAFEDRARWPQVQRDEWCGRFAAKDSTATGVVVGPAYIQE
jgi:hypothetical protein